MKYIIERRPACVRPTLASDVKGADGFTVEPFFILYAGRPSSLGKESWISFFLSFFSISRIGLRWTDGQTRWSDQGDAAGLLLLLYRRGRQEILLPSPVRSTRPEAKCAIQKADGAFADVQCLLLLLLQFFSLSTKQQQTSLSPLSDFTCSPFGHRLWSRQSLLVLPYTVSIYMWITVGQGFCAAMKLLYMHHVLRRRPESCNIKWHWARLVPHDFLSDCTCARSRLCTLAHRLQLH